MTILITIGTLSDKKFTRLFKIIDELCEDGTLDGENVLAQIGTEPYSPNHFKYFNMVEGHEFDEMIEKADIVITHGGSGTITRCLKAGKKVIVFPRQLRYDEHFDNHQMELSDVFTKKGYVLSATNKEELKKNLEDIVNFTPKLFESNRRKINNIVIDSIENEKEFTVGLYNLVRGLWTK